MIRKNWKFHLHYRILPWVFAAVVGMSGWAYAGWSSYTSQALLDQWKVVAGLCGLVGDSSQEG